MHGFSLDWSANLFADIWGPVERGNAMALFSCMTFIVSVVLSASWPVIWTLTNTRDLLSVLSSQDSYSLLRIGAGVSTFYYG
jgi:hypothetical protein